MKPKFVLVALFAITCVVGVLQSSARADYGRQYYGGWSYHPQRTYYFRSYYYKPHVNYDGYRYHYCVYYPTRPRYVYYYNPYRQVYWGRFDLETKGYSKLEAKDQKGDLTAIPESAFPDPGVMPSVPEAEDGVQMAKIAPTDLPSREVPKDIP